MIPSNPNNPKQTNPIKRPQNKDDLDSRANEEQQDKGKHSTHNKKETKDENE
jgi:hypothetical protein